MTGSLALVSDAAHGAFDALSTLILLVATSLSLKPADEDHTYGHGKIETIGALIGGVGLFVLGGGILVLAVFRVTVGTVVHSSWMGYAAAAYTMIVDVFRIGILSLVLKAGSLTIRAGLYDAISDFASTALVFVGFGLVSLGYPMGDTAVSLILATLLVYLSLRLIHGSALELSDAVSGKLVQSILREIRRTDEVLKTKELRVRRVGQLTYVDAIIAVSSEAPLVDAHAVTSKVEANLTKLLGKSSIMIHAEPLDWEVPVERQIRNITNNVSGARGIHNLSVATVSGGLYVTLHVQVEPSLDLESAHRIAEAIERGIEKSITEVRQVTVHLEPLVPETTSARIIGDKYMSDAIRSIVQAYPGVAKISSITTYATGTQLHINVHCLFKGEIPISEVHEMVSKIEENIRQKFNKAIVTIHPEPIEEPA